MPRTPTNPKPCATGSALDEERDFLTVDLADRRLDTTHTRAKRLARNDRIRKAGLPREGATGSWITTPPKAVATERKSAGWQKDAVYFGSTTHDGTTAHGPVEPDRTHQKVGLQIAPGFTARIDNPDAKALGQAVGATGSFRIIRNGRTVAQGVWQA